MTAITLPTIANIRANASVLHNGESQYEIRICKQADCLRDRTYYMASNQQPVVLRRDKATFKNSLHQLPTCGLSESGLAYMLNNRLFSQTGLFAPADINDAAIVTGKRWRSSVAMAHAVTRELSRRAAADDQSPFSADLFMRKPSAELAADMLAAGSLGGIAAAGYSVRADVMQQLLGDFVICGAVLVPVDGGIRGLTRAYKINAAWQPALAAAAKINGALPETPSEPAQSVEPVAMADAA